MVTLGLYGDNGKENGIYNLGLKVSGAESPLSR